MSQGTIHYAGTTVSHVMDLVHQTTVLGIT